ncbi:Hypothetical predicted protein [Olea europaea subsp. europaea]|uniref:Uncharacterized protein n=1 Tax=Olea europaea subsp. europaea TaxID=158383 RepID=A0A8S0T0X6_OLEEU|nr:Hypothetical predicted protein [Olea europaea subsp. europaea]
MEPGAIVAVDKAGRMLPRAATEALASKAEVSAAAADFAAAAVVARCRQLQAVAVGQRQPPPHEPRGNPNSGGLRRMSQGATTPSLK